MSLVRSSFAFSLSLFCAAGLAQSVPQRVFDGLSYRLVGPGRAGRSLTCTGVPDNPDKYYMGAVGGGVWVTENSGRTWTPLFDRTGVASIGALAVAWSDPKVIYVGTGEADMRSDIQQGDGVYKSTDGGVTWSHIGLTDTRQIGKVIVDPHDPNRVYVAALGHQYGPNAERGVFKSTDGGETWTKSLYLNRDTGAVELVMYPGNPDTLLAGMWQTRRPPWNVYPPSSGPGSGLYKTTDGGTTWKKVTSGLPKTFGRVGLAFCPSIPQRVYAVVDTGDKSGGGLYASQDGGENWKKVNGDPRLWGRGWYFCGVTVDPSAPDTLYVCNTATYRSSDGGKTFAPFKGAPGGDDYHTLWINPSEPHRMALASDQGTVVSVDGGKTWSSWWNQPTGQFYHVIADDRFPYWVYGSQQDSGAMAVPSRTNHDTIGMRDWRPMEVGGESGTIAPDGSRPGTLLDNGGTIERLEDGWHKTVDPTQGKLGGPWRSNWTMPIVASPLDPKVFYTSRQAVFRTADGGETWKLISRDLSRPKNVVPANLDAPTAADGAAARSGVVYWLAPSPLKKGMLWAGTDDGLVWLTRNEGKTWMNVTPAQLAPWSKVGVIDASRFDAETATIAVDRHRLDDNHPYVYRTHDGGKHWKLVSAGLPQGQFVNVAREDPFRRNLLYAGTDWGVFVSFDEGGRWQPLQLNLPPASVRDIVFAGHDVVVGTHGRAIWILDDASLLRQVGLNQPTTLFQPSPAVLFIRGPGFDDGTPLPKDEARCQNPPDGAVIDYYLATDASLVTLTVRDDKGKALKTFQSSDRPLPPDLAKIGITPDWIPAPPSVSAMRGGHRLVWDMSAGRGERVRPGLYQVTLKVDGRAYTRALRVVKDPRDR